MQSNYPYIHQNHICSAYGAVKSAFFSSIYLWLILSSWLTVGPRTLPPVLLPSQLFSALHLWFDFSPPQKESFAFFTEFDLTDFRPFHQCSKIILNSNPVHWSAHKPFNLDVIHKFYSLYKSLLSFKSLMKALRKTDPWQIIVGPHLQHSSSFTVNHW